MSHEVNIVNGIPGKVKVTVRDIRNGEEVQVSRVVKMHDKCYELSDICTARNEYYNC